MPTYNLIEYSDVYSKTSWSLWQYYRDETALDNNNNIIDFLIITTVVFCSANSRERRKKKKEKC